MSSELDVLASVHAEVLTDIVSNYNNSIYLYIMHFIPQATEDINSTITSLYLEVSLATCMTSCDVVMGKYHGVFPSYPLYYSCQDVHLFSFPIQSSNSVSYVQDALQLLKPVLQYTVLQEVALQQPGPNVHSRS